MFQIRGGVASPGLLFCKAKSHLIALATGCQGNKKKKDKFYRTDRKIHLPFHAQVGVFWKSLRFTVHLCTLVFSDHLSAVGNNVFGSTVKSVTYTWRYFEKKTVRKSFVLSAICKGWQGGGSQKSVLQQRLREQLSAYHKCKSTMIFHISKVLTGRLCFVFVNILGNSKHPSVQLMHRSTTYMMRMVIYYHLLDYITTTNYNRLHRIYIKYLKTLF